MYSNKLLKCLINLKPLNALRKYSQTVTRQYTRSKPKEIGPFGWCLLAIPGATFALGTWQVQRKAWKEDLIRQLKERTESQPVSLPKDFNLEEIRKLEYYPVHVQGTFLHDNELYMGPRTLLAKGDSVTTSSLLSKDNRQSQGYLIITPFKLADRNETILINRGWVPTKNKDPKTREKGQIKGVTQVIGIVRLHENRPNFMPKNSEESNLWLYRDLDQMCKATGATIPVFLDATEDFQTDESPIGGQTRVSLRNEHLSYIFTWYSLSGLTSYMWYMQFLKK